MVMSYSFIGEDDHLLILHWDDLMMERYDLYAHVYNIQDGGSLGIIEIILEDL